MEVGQLYTAPTGAVLLATSETQACAFLGGALQTVEVHGKHDYTLNVANGNNFTGCCKPVSDPLSIRDTDSADHTFVRVLLDDTRTEHTYVMEYESADKETKTCMARFYNIYTRSEVWPTLAGDCWNIGEAMFPVVIGSGDTMWVNGTMATLKSMTKLDVFASPMRIDALETLAHLHFGSNITWRDAVQCMAHQPCDIVFADSSSSNLKLLNVHVTDIVSTGDRVTARLRPVDTTTDDSLTLHVRSMCDDMLAMMLESAASKQLVSVISCTPTVGDTHAGVVERPRARAPPLPLNVVKGALTCTRCSTRIDALMLDAHEHWTWDGTCTNCRQAELSTYIAPTFVMVHHLNDAARINILSQPVQPLETLRATAMRAHELGVPCVRISVLDKCCACKQAFAPGNTHMQLDAIPINGSSTLRYCRNCARSAACTKDFVYYGTLNASLLYNWAHTVNELHAACLNWNHCAARMDVDAMQEHWRFLCCLTNDMTGRMSGGVDWKASVFAALKARLRTYTRDGVSTEVASSLQSYMRDFKVASAPVRAHTAFGRMIARAGLNARAALPDAALADAPAWLCHELDLSTGVFRNEFLKAHCSKDALTLPNLSDAVRMACPWFPADEFVHPEVLPNDVQSRTHVEPRTVCISDDKDTFTAARVVTDAGPILVRVSSKYLGVASRGLWGRNPEQLQDMFIPDQLTVHLATRTGHGYKNALAAARATKEPGTMELTLGTKAGSERIVMMDEIDAPTPASARYGKAIPKTTPTLHATAFVEALEHMFNTAGTGDCAGAVDAYVERYAPQFIRQGETCPFNTVPLLDAPPHAHFRKCIRAFLNRIEPAWHVLLMHCDDDTATVLRDVRMRDCTQPVRTLSFIKFDKAGLVEMEISSSVEEADVGEAWMVGHANLKREGVSSMFLHRLSSAAHIMRLPFDDNVCAVTFGHDDIDPELIRKCRLALMRIWKDGEVPAFTGERRAVAGRLTYAETGAVFSVLADSTRGEELPSTLADLIMDVPSNGAFHMRSL
jgi:hypothetical protein